MRISEECRVKNDECGAENESSAFFTPHCSFFTYAGIGSLIGRAPVYETGT